MPKMSKFIIGIDIGGTNTKIGLIKGSRIKKRFVLKTRLYPKREDLLKAIIEIIKNLLRQERLSSRDILGIGMGLPGAIDYKTGIVRYLPNIPGWQNVHLVRLMQNSLNIPTFIDNDVNLMALAESHYGHGKGKQNIVCLTLGTGVGGGLILEGRLYRGTNFSAGELGHIPIDINGPLCSCGGRGCLESFIGNRQIKSTAKQVFGKAISLEELSSLAKIGNKKATKLWQEVGRHLGMVLSGVVNLLNPEVIIIAGGVAFSGRILFEQIRKTLYTQAMLAPRRVVKVKKAKIKQPGIIGAGILVKQGRGGL